MVDEGVASDGIGTLHWRILLPRTTLSTGGKASAGVEHH
jgi:hypothetical protein